VDGSPKRLQRWDVFKIRWRWKLECDRFACSLAGEEVIGAIARGDAAMDCLGERLRSGQYASAIWIDEKSTFQLLGVCARRPLTALSELSAIIRARINGAITRLWIQNWITWDRENARCGGRQPALRSTNWSVRRLGVRSETREAKRCAHGSVDAQRPINRAGGTQDSGRGGVMVRRSLYDDYCCRWRRRNRHRSRA